MYRLFVMLLLLMAAPAAAQQATSKDPFSGADLEASRKSFQARPDLKAASACIARDAAACTAYGELLMTGTPDTKQDQPLAVRNFAKACDLGHAPGCYALGAAMQAGRGTAVNLADARKAYTKACEGGNATGCTGAGRMYVRGQGGAADVVKGMTYLNKACDEKVALACSALGSHYAGTGSTPTDSVKAGEFHGRACVLGQAMSCGERDRMALFSKPAAARISAAEVAAASAAQAARPDLKAQADCAARNGEACTQYGLMQMNGAANVKQDAAAAVASFGQACTLANGPGCRALGMALQAGRGAAIDLSRARASYLAACAARDASGCGRAGAMHAGGLGGAKDLPQGLALMTQGCELRDGAACNGLGQHYAVNSPVDLAKAAIFFGKACDLGNAQACANRDRAAAGPAAR